MGSRVLREGWPHTLAGTKALQIPGLKAEKKAREGRQQEVEVRRAFPRSFAFSCPDSITVLMSLP